MPGSGVGVAPLFYPPRRLRDSKLRAPPRADAWTIHKEEEPGASWGPSSQAGHFRAGNQKFRAQREPWKSTGNASERFKGKSICKSKLHELQAPSLLERVTREHPTSLVTGGLA